ncbi:hypothetical protein BX616_010782 [Lobosporangium transversale]|uniref:Uncharacterized protein n=1 Tax=Lobosporangium transversale TaxID=64571 RepID=A0A1Y2GC82_9FUNG|nr:hypothetical protein BCR41DRAFT_375124 [Lobosporangium transversale]KAF9910760.1 hypothetical protein BX616_010782 [Lobosporangium transversale]ORZ02037.1 hypothetical protein BCR41DRAFT_375124 [Lobosporangium transversale]|eukprot:XP_021876265.1 hypothetical protein BCR41DRAFT_375124 [Lobosporangium transversale]
MVFSEPWARRIAVFLVCVIFIQLLFLFHDPLQSVLLRNTNNDADGSRTTTSDRIKAHHPTVPLDLPELAILDELSSVIVDREAQRTFAKSGYATIHGTTIADDPEEAKRIRDQIDCWSKYGSWVRDDEGPTAAADTNDTSPLRPWSARKHYGDPLFNKCDVRFMDGLNDIDNAGLGAYFQGTYDDQDGHGWIVREAVKYKWVPDENICGPHAVATTSTTPIGLRDARAEYKSFNKAEFCKSLAQRSMLLAGDVTQYQLHDAILSAVQATPFVCHGEHSCLHAAPHELCPPTTDDGVEIPRPAPGGIDGTDGATIQPTVPSLKYARNDVISIPQAFHLGDYDNNDNDFPNAKTIEQAWATDMVLKNYGIVFLNKGLHYQPDEEFLTELVFTMKQLWKFYPDLVIIYRATHPTSNCTILKEQKEDGALGKLLNEGKDTDQNGPLLSVNPGAALQQPLAKAPARTSERLVKRDLQASGSSNTDEAYIVSRPSLADVQRQNKMAKVIVESAGGIFLDTEEMFAKRPDGRMGDGDCSRFCAPGPLDAYVELVFNALRILQIKPYQPLDIPSY